MTKADISERSNTISAAEYLREMTQLVRVERTIIETTSRAAAARGEKAGILKRMKNAGADIDAFKMLVKLKALDDDDRNRVLENMNTYAGWEGVPMWIAPTDARPQGSLFDDDAEAAEAKQNHHLAGIYTAGWDARNHGEAADDCPYKIGGAPERQAWMGGWEERDEQMKANPAPAAAVKASTARKPAKAKDETAEPKKRGRPPGKKADADAAPADATIN